MSHTHHKHANKHTPRHNKISLTHDRGTHAARVLDKSKKELVDTTERPPSRAWCGGQFLSLHPIATLKKGATK